MIVFGHYCSTSSLRDSVGDGSHYYRSACLLRKTIIVYVVRLSLNDYSTKVENIGSCVCSGVMQTISWCVWGVGHLSGISDEFNETNRKPQKIINPSLHWGGQSILSYRFYVCFIILPVKWRCGSYNFWGSVQDWPEPNVLAPMADVIGHVWLSFEFVCV